MSDEVASMDIISSLPDPILCHILSFVSIECSVKTSVLARRWRHLWTYVSRLKFISTDGWYSKPEKMMEFSRMVDRVLTLHNGSIHSLSIESNEDTYVCEHQAEEWVRIAMAHGVHDFLLSDVWCPHFKYKCNNLVELTLSQCRFCIEPGAVRLPSLKKLRLLSNSYDNDQSLPNLVSGCSAVEHLVIERLMNMCDDMLCCYVCSPTLKSLVLNFEQSCDDHDHKLVLDVPAVQNLRVRNDASQIIRADDLSSLVLANIEFFNEDPVENTKRSRHVFRFIAKLSNARSLTITSDDLMRVLNRTFSFATRRFHNLIDLELQADWRILTDLLASADKLESLTIHIHKEKDDLERWRKPKQLPECLLSSLKIVTICGFLGLKHELNLVRYILRHARVLNKMRIDSVSYEDDYKLKLLQKISYFPRGSRRCHLTFV